MGTFAFQTTQSHTELMHPYIRLRQDALWDLGKSSIQYLVLSTFIFFSHFQLKATDSTQIALHPNKTSSKFMSIRKTYSSQSNTALNQVQVMIKELTW